MLVQYSSLLNLVGDNKDKLFDRTCFGGEVMILDTTLISLAVPHINENFVRMDSE